MVWTGGARTVLKHLHKRLEAGAQRFQAGGVLHLQQQLGHSGPVELGPDQTVVKGIGLAELLDDKDDALRPALLDLVEQNEGEVVQVG